MATNELAVSEGCDECALPFFRVPETAHEARLFVLRRACYRKERPVGYVFCKNGSLAVVVYFIRLMSFTRTVG